MYRFITPLSLAIAAIAAPAAAQDSARDFTLPAGPPEPETRPQGPVDDSGVIPVGPRVIRPPAQQPAPSAPAPAAEPSQSPPPPRAQPEAAPAQTAASRRSPAPAAQPVEQPAERPRPTESPRQLVLPTPDPSAADAPRPDANDTIGGSDPLITPLPLWVLWLACGLGLGAIALGLLAWRRRAGRPAVPDIEPPLAPNATQDSKAIGAPRFTTSLEVQGFTRSVMMVTLEFAINIANRSDVAMRDVRISADLVSASRHLPMDQQVATETAILGQVAQLDRIGPNQARSTTGTLQLPVNAIAPFFQGKTPLFMPLVRLRIECTGALPHLKTYTVGIGSSMTVGKVSPIPLNTAPGGVLGVMARALD